MTNIQRLLTLLLLVGLPALPAEAFEPPSLDAAATQLLQATVTVRVSPGVSPLLPNAADSAGTDPDDDLAARTDPAQCVTVCSGVSLGEGLVVTYFNASTNDRIRITAPGGNQTDAKLLVVDQYSGLVLLGTERHAAAGLNVADKLPGAGTWIAGAAAWGTEEPAISVGVLGAVNRSLPSTGFPPLLQCDLRTAETSSGGPIVDRQGRLIGVIVAAAAGQQQGWTYAAPVGHVQRLVRAKVNGKLIVLKRRRPTVGLVLTAGKQPETVVVQRVVAEGPADKAGLRVGDQILAADETRIRSVYQALRPVLQKQPGDKLTLLVQRDTETQSIEVTLGGGVQLPASPASRDAGPVGSDASLVDQRIQINRVGPLRFDVTRPEFGVRNLSFPQPSGDDRESPRQDGQALLEKALERYGLLIKSLQQQLEQREQDRIDLQQQIRTLEAEVSSLRRQMVEMNEQP